MVTNGIKFFETHTCYHNWHNCACQPATPSEHSIRPELAVVRPAERCVAVAAGLDLADALAECPEVRSHACLPMAEKISRDRPGPVLLGVC